MGMGSQLIIGLLFLLLIIVIYIYFERLFAIKSASKISPIYGANQNYVLNHKIDGAQALCLSENKPVARLVAKVYQGSVDPWMTSAPLLKMPVD